MAEALSPIGDLEIYKMLSDSLRLKILKLLSKNKLCVGEIVSETGESQPLISHKLKDLREKGLVVSFRNGKNIIYELVDPSIRDLLRLGETTGTQVANTCSCVECEEEITEESELNY